MQTRQAFTVNCPNTRLATPVGDGVCGRLCMSIKVCVCVFFFLVFKFFLPEKMEAGVSGAVQVADGVMGRCCLGFR